MRSALETPQAAQKNYAELSQESLEAAAMWMVYCAETLLRQSTSHGGRDFDGKLGRAGDGYQEKDWKGLNRDRWILWKETMQAITASGQQGATKEAERAQNTTIDTDLLRRATCAHDSSRTASSYSALALA